MAGLVPNRKHGLLLCLAIKSYVKMSLPVSFCFQICVFTDLTVNLKSEIGMKNKRNSKCSPFRSFDIINLPVLSTKKKKMQEQVSFSLPLLLGIEEQDKSTQAN